MLGLAKIVGTGERFSISAVCLSVFGFKHATVRIKILKNDWFGEISLSVSMRADNFIQLHEIFHSADSWLECLSGDDRKNFQARLVDDFCSYFIFDMPDSDNFYRNLGRSAFIGPQIRHVAGLMNLAATYQSFDAARNAHN